jgi:hypothetical protein
LFLWSDYQLFSPQPQKKPESGALQDCPQFQASTRDHARSLPVWCVYLIRENMLELFLQADADKKRNRLLDSVEIKTKYSQEMLAKCVTRYSPMKEFQISDFEQYALARKQPPPLLT